MSRAAPAAGATSLLRLPAPHAAPLAAPLSAPHAAPLSAPLAAPPSAPVAAPLALLLSALLGASCATAPPPRPADSPDRPAEGAGASAEPRVRPALDPSPRQSPALEGFTARAPARVERVVDGDTLVLAGGERVRVLGIDAPELDSEEALVLGLAERAGRDLERLAAAGPVRLHVPDAQPTDRYGRTLAYVHDQSGRDLGASLIERGLARSYPTAHPRLAPYLALERAARRAGRGLWAPEPRRALGLDVELTVDAGEAGEHVGRRARVIGRVHRVHRAERVTFVDLGPDWRTDFVAVAFSPIRELLPADAESRWTGRIVAVTGTIGEHEGRPEIVLESPGDVEVLDARPGG